VVTRTGFSGMATRVAPLGACRLVLAAPGLLGF
jgi:hypothetical protein